MVANQHSTRIDTLELKTLLYRKIGLERADRYFDLLKKFISFKLAKNEFDKFCIRTIGRDNLSLHNRLIRSILNNSCLAKVPPLTVKKVAGPLNVKVANGYQRNSLQSLYGDAFPLSPRKSRSPRDRKFKDRQSPLGPNVKTHPVTCDEARLKVQDHQSPTELHSLGSRPPIEVLSVESGEEVVSESPCIQSRSPVTPPLGISLKVVGPRKTLNGGSVYDCRRTETCENSCELPDSRLLKTRLLQKLENEGLNISIGCVNSLNNGLDVYLKRLIEPCLGLARSRTSQTTPGPNRIFPGRSSQGRTVSVSASMLDFCVAMESDPRNLGRNWATELEKIRFRAMEE